MQYEILVQFFKPTRALALLQISIDNNCQLALLCEVLKGMAYEEGGGK